MRRAFLAVAALTACGGKVVIDGSAGASGAAGGGTVSSSSAGGGTAASSSAGGGTATSSSAGGGTAASTSTSGTGGAAPTGIKALCVQVADLHENNCGAWDYTSCMVADVCAGKCAPLYTAFVACYAAQGAAAGCGAPPPCADAFKAYTKCEKSILNAPCAAPSTCSKNGGFFACEIASTTCAGHMVGISCADDPTEFTCSCTLDGVLVGTCVDPSYTCDPVGGCCATMFGL
jgi:hypothetical protein